MSACYLKHLKATPRWAGTVSSSITLALRGFASQWTSGGCKDTVTPFIALARAPLGTRLPQLAREGATPAGTSAPRRPTLGDGVTFHVTHPRQRR